MYPIPAIQQRKAFVGCTSLLTPILILQPMMDGLPKCKKFVDQMAKVKRWAGALLDQVVKDGEFSSGAKRDIEAISYQCGKYLADGSRDREARIWRCVALFQAAVGWEYNIYATCPIYSRRKEYRYMDMCAERLAVMFEECWPGSQEEGTRIYMEN